MPDHESRPAPAGCDACASGGCPSRTVPLDPRQMTVEERRLWLESYKRHLEQRLAEVNRHLASL